MSFVSPEFVLFCLFFFPLYWSLAEHPRVQRSLLIISGYGLYATWVPAFAAILAVYSTVVWALGRWMRHALSPRMPLLLGLWLAETEGAKFWLSVLTELKNRGLSDIFFVCCDGLTGLSGAIETVFPKAVVQTCIGGSHVVTRSNPPDESKTPTTCFYWCPRPDLNRHGLSA